jgi:hypothetical protein
MTLIAQVRSGEDLGVPSGGYRGGMTSVGGGGSTIPPYQQSYPPNIASRLPSGLTGMPTLPPTLTPTAPGGTTAPPATPTPTVPPVATSTPTAPATPAVTAQSATGAFNNFANSAGMKFAEQQAMNQLQNYYAAHGLLSSGPAMKGISDYIQNMALQNYFFPYMNYLSGQQAMGAQAGSAIAGVGSSYGNTVNGLGQNYSNAVTGINSGIGNALSQGALNIGNANANQAAIGGLAGANLGSAIGSGLGSLGSSFFQPHY